MISSSAKRDSTHYDGVLMPVGCKRSVGEPVGASAQHSADEGFADGGFVDGDPPRWTQPAAP
ncbi:MAG: hypothetical protein ACRDRG_11825 [Pseudonocardiaceae bacterium]